MKNLAGNKDCDKYIREELTRCGIDIVVEPSDSRHSEVPYTLTGKLGNFTFHRAWYYWVVKGKVPIEVARRLYDSPVGKTDIRVNGSCICSAPEGVQVNWYDKETGKQYRSQEDWNEAENLASHAKSFASYWEQEKHKWQVSNNPECGYGFIEGYHIDSELGLYIFAQEVKSFY